MNKELEPSMRAIDYQRIVKFKDSLKVCVKEIGQYMSQIEEQYDEFHIPDS